MTSEINEFRILDLFCGAGGLSWGMHKNRYFKTMVALDFDENAIVTFKKNMPDTEVLVGDITDVAVKRKSRFPVKEEKCKYDSRRSTMPRILYEGQKTWTR